MSDESTITLHHALFGYADGHRQIAASARIPSRDMYHLAAASDLASNVFLGPGESYLTGLPLEESGLYALIRTWPAPEMSRPGCVWSHVLLLDQKVLTIYGDLAGLLTAFKFPLGVARSFYSTPLLVEASPVSLSFRDTRVISVIISNYYAERQTILAVEKSPEVLEAAIFSVWSQQWPRLRAIFSFRTASMTGVWKANYDIQVTASSPPSEIVAEDWVEAGVADVTSRSVTSLRRFLWRYGRDISSPRSRYKTLVKTFLVAHRNPEEMPLELAKRIVEALPDKSDGEILKKDILGLGTSSLSLCPPVSFLTMSRLIDDDRLASLVQPGDLRRRVDSVPQGDLVAVANIAAIRAPDDELWAEALDGLIGRADSDLVRADIPHSLRLRILLSREDLIDAEVLSLLSHEDYYTLFVRHADPSIRRIILREALRYEVRAPHDDAYLSEDPVSVFFLAIDAQRSDRLHGSWRDAIRGFRQAILGHDILGRIRSLGDLSTAIYLLQIDLTLFGKSASDWAALLPNMQRDAAESDTLRLFASLLAIALEAPCIESWSVITLTFPELRASTLRGQLPYEASRVLERALPHMRWDDWDMNKRMLLALHRLQLTIPPPASALVRANLSEEEKDLVLYGPKEASKKSSLLWWL